MIAFIDDHRDAYGVEPICRVLPIAPSTYHERVGQRQDSTRLSARAQWDVALKPEIARVRRELRGADSIGRRNAMVFDLREVLVKRLRRCSLA